MKTRRLSKRRPPPLPFQLGLDYDLIFYLPTLFSSSLRLRVAYLIHGEIKEESVVRVLYMSLRRGFGSQGVRPRN